MFIVQNFDFDISFCELFWQKPQQCHIWEQRITFIGLINTLVFHLEDFIPGFQSLGNFCSFLVPHLFTVLTVSNPPCQVISHIDLGREGSGKVQTYHMLSKHFSYELTCVGHGFHLRVNQ